jgi:hypothetical protein
VTLFPGAAAALTLAAVDHVGGAVRFGAVLAGAFAFAGAVAASLRVGPLRPRPGTGPGPAGGPWVCWLLAYTVCGDGLLAALGGRSGEAWGTTLSPLVALACAVVPAAWCAHLFAAGAGRRLARSRTLADFAAGTRPLLLACVVAYAGALSGIALLARFVFHGGGDPAHVVALGTLLLLARLLVVHGFPGAAITGLATACGVEALALGSVLASRLPGCSVLGAPVGGLVDAWGAGAVPALACAVAALGLAARGTTTLTRASAHT